MMLIIFQNKFKTLILFEYIYIYVVILCSTLEGMLLVFLCQGVVLTLVRNDSF